MAADWCRRVLLRLFEAPPGRVVNRVGGWVERGSRPRGGCGSAGGRLAVRVTMGRSSDRTSSLGKPARALRRSAAFPVGRDSAGDARAVPRADRVVAYSRRQALTEPPASARGKARSIAQAVRDGVAGGRRAADARRGGLPHGVVCMAGPDEGVGDLAQKRVSDVGRSRLQHVGESAMGRCRTGRCRRGPWRSRRGTVARASECRSVVRVSWSKACRQAAVDAVRVMAVALAAGARGGQCTAVEVGQYSTLRWCISASSSRSW